MLTVLEEERDKDGNLKKVKVESVRYVESDTAPDQSSVSAARSAASRTFWSSTTRPTTPIASGATSREDEEEQFGEEDEAEEFFKEATVWVDGLDRIHKLRGINLLRRPVGDTRTFSAASGRTRTGRFPWVVSDFGLIDAIEVGLVKIPQLAVRDTTGAAIPGYFNIWHWILPKLTPAERGGSRPTRSPKQS